jgi:hypothetical protein
LFEFEISLSFKSKKNLAAQYFPFTISEANLFFSTYSPQQQQTHLPFPNKSAHLVVLPSPAHSPSCLPPLAAKPPPLGRAPPSHSIFRVPPSGPAHHHTFAF